MEQIRLIDCGTIEYAQALDLQRKTHRECQEGEEGALLLCEHPHVYTLGRSGKESNLLVNEKMLENIGASFFHTDRGGDITYHGYGQLVCYPIVDIGRLGLSVKGYVDALESAVIESVAEFGVEGYRIKGRTGVWVGGGGQERKICAIGVHVSRFITLHGLALNVNTDLSYFSHINPCGFAVGSVTSLKEECGAEVDMDTVKESMVKSLLGQLRCKIK